MDILKLAFILACVSAVGNLDVKNLTCIDRTEILKRSAHFGCRNGTFYHFVFSESSDTYVEFCNPNHMVKEGHMVVQDRQSAQLKLMECLKDTYQPHQYLSNEQCGCSETKSKCDGRGQVIASIGSSTEDRTCRCDFTKGYMFQYTPQQRCYCKPKVENCACVLKFCPTGTKLTPDYICTDETMYLKLNYTCPGFVQGNEQKNCSFPVITNSCDKEITFYIVVTIGVVACIIACTIGFIFWIQGRKRGEKGKHLKDEEKVSTPEDTKNIKITDDYKEEGRETEPLITQNDGQQSNSEVSELITNTYIDEQRDEENKALKNRHAGTQKISHVLNQTENERKSITGEKGKHLKDEEKVSTPEDTKNIKITDDYKEEGRETEPLITQNDGKQSNSEVSELITNTYVDEQRHEENKALKNRQAGTQKISHVLNQTENERKSITGPITSNNPYVNNENHKVNSENLVNTKADIHSFDNEQHTEKDTCDTTEKQVSVDIKVGVVATREEGPSVKESNHTEDARTNIEITHAIRCEPINQQTTKPILRTLRNYGENEMQEASGDTTEKQVPMDIEVCLGTTRKEDSETKTEITHGDRCEPIPIPKQITTQFFRTSRNYEEIEMQGASDFTLHNVQSKNVSAEQPDMENGEKKN